MHKEVAEGKNFEDAKSKALEKLNANESEVIIINLEEKKGLFSKKAEVAIITKEEINKSIKEYILKIIKEMGLDAQIEIKNREERPIFNIITKDSNILIGKNGRTIDSLQTITTAMLNQELSTHYYFLIDVNDYKQRKEKRLEKLAKYTAKDVARTKIEVSLDPMNSYERRIIHNTLSNSKDVYTESVGEEPNRYVVVKPKEE